MRSQCDVAACRIACQSGRAACGYVYSLVYTASGDSIDTVMVDGRILMGNRELTTIDLDEVHAKCRELAPKLAARAKVKPVSRWPVR